MSRHQKKSGTKVGKVASKADSLKSGAPNTHEITTLVALFNAGHHAEGERLARALTVRFPQHGFGCPPQWRAADIVSEMQREGIASNQVLIEHNGRLVDFIHQPNPYQKTLTE